MLNRRNFLHSSGLLLLAPLTGAKAGNKILKNEAPKCQKAEAQELQWTRFEDELPVCHEVILCLDISYLPPVMGWAAYGTLMYSQEGEPISASVRIFEGVKLSVDKLRYTPTEKFKNNKHIEIPPFCAYWIYAEDILSQEPKDFLLETPNPGDFIVIGRVNLETNKFTRVRVDQFIADGFPLEEFIDDPGMWPMFLATDPTKSPIIKHKVKNLPVHKLYSCYRHPAHLRNEMLDDVRWLPLPKLSIGLRKCLIEENSSNPQV